MKDSWTIGDLAQVNPTASKASRAQVDDEVVFLPMAAVKEDGSYDASARRVVGDVRTGFTYFERGDVLLAKITPCMENGKATFLGDLDTPFGFGSTEFHVLRPKAGVDPRFVFHAIWNSRFRKAAGSAMQGAAGQQRVPASFVESFPIPRLEPGEQRHIADLLDRADAIRRKRREALRSADELVRATFLEMFGDPVGNPKGWERRPLDSLVTLVTGNTPSRERKEWYGYDIEWIKSDNIGHQAWYLTAATEGLSAEGRTVARTAPAGSVLMTCIAGSPDSIGKLGIADREVAFNQQINALVPHDLADSAFVFGMFKVAKKMVQDLSTEAMKGMVTKGRLAALSVPIPPVELRREFSSKFKALDRVRERANSSVADAESLFASLQNQAFAGMP